MDNKDINVEAIIEAAKFALEDKKAEDIQILNLTGVSDIADCFIIASGNNVNQVRAMSDAVEEKLDIEHDFRVSHREGYTSATWILLDYGNILVHIFNKEERAFYNLDRVWKDANN